MNTYYSDALKIEREAHEATRMLLLDARELLAVFATSFAGLLIIILLSAFWV